MKTNPYIVRMPLIMIGIALTCIFCSLFVSNIIFDIVYIGATALFIFIPISTIGILIDRYESDSKFAITIMKRKLITIVPIVAIVALYQIGPLSSKIALFSIGALGTIYFYLDYLKQNRTLLTFKARLRGIKSDSNFLDSLLRTKCSRNVLKCYVKTMAKGNDRDEVTKAIESSEYKWWHLFPFSLKSLTVELFEMITLSKEKRKQRKERNRRKKENKEKKAQIN